MGRPASALAVGCYGKGRFSVSSRLHWAIRLCNSTSDVFKCIKVKELSSCSGWLVVWIRKQYSSGGPCYHRFSGGCSNDQNIL